MSELFVRDDSLERAIFYLILRVLMVCGLLLILTIVYVRYLASTSITNQPTAVVNRSFAKIESRLGERQAENYRRMGPLSRPLTSSGQWSQTTTGISQPAARLEASSDHGSWVG